MPTPNPYTPAEEQKYEGIFAAAKFHRDEYHRCEQSLKPYRDWHSVSSAAPAYTAAEVQAFEELAATAEYHFREMYECELRLKSYRDLKNVIECAAEEGYAEGLAESLPADQAARLLLQKNMPLSLIARVTGLSKAEIEALRQ